ncbi:uncharacterized protein AC631_02982 [Debaryomyces fabryi]|uniref:Agglutinin-like protein N-terminal domain-containing protein n=1 Tax=Debaryomyces fabryi TaxID=58627 RepID=A0A0V1PYM6_9ASCO|nr:uncharacterized protein AC631_02982 [Debaryomyces fabryi]KSA01286.1 hypothetical protein AC631_02982 [Debaryomyces fabryi]
MKTSFNTLFIALVLLETATAITLTNIWQSLEITNPSILNRPQDIRKATVGWKISTAAVLPNDIFFFLMPYVFKTKFDSDEILLKASGTVYARCKVNDGSFNSDTSYFKCTMTSSVDDKKGLTATGEIEIDFVFNAGGSSSDSDILSAKRFVSGNNQISFNNMESDVNFQAGPFFRDKKTDELLYYSRSTPQDLEQVFILSGTCNEGITSGSIVFTTNNSVDCSQFKLKITNDLNDFYLPKSYKSVGVGSIRCSSDNTKLTATFNNVPLGYRVFLEGFEKYPDNSDFVKHLYAENIQCGDGSSKIDGITKIIRVVDGVSSSGGNIEESSSIESSSSLEMTSTHEISSSCTQSMTTSTTDTETTLNTNTVTKTVCTECAHETSKPSTESSTIESTTTESSTIESTTTESTTTESSTIESTTIESTTIESTTIESTTIESTTIESSTIESFSIESSTTDITPSSSKATSETSCESCVRSSILSTSVAPSTSETTAWHPELLHETETISCIECTSSPSIQTQTETTSSVNSTTETITCHNCSSSSILSTSIPPAIGTTETSISSKYISCVECESSQKSESVPSISDSTTTYAEPLGNNGCALCDTPPITEAETISDTITCEENCTTTFPTYVPGVSSSELPQSGHPNILPTSSIVESSHAQPQSGVADTSTTSLSIASTASITPSHSEEYPSSSLYISPYVFSSYEALSHSKRCSWMMLLFSLLALLV